MACGGDKLRALGDEVSSHLPDALIEECVWQCSDRGEPEAGIAKLATALFAGHPGNRNVLLSERSLGQLFFYDGSGWKHAGRQRVLDAMAASACRVLQLAFFVGKDRFRAQLPDALFEAAEGYIMRERDAWPQKVRSAMYRIVFLRAVAGHSSGLTAMLACC